MKKLAAVLVAIIIVAALAWMLWPAPVPVIPTAPSAPPVAITPAPVPVTAQEAPGAIIQPATANPPVEVIRPAPVPIRPTAVVNLDRADKSGICVLPSGVTYGDVVEIYIDGKPVDRGRISPTYAADEVDVWDTRPHSKITALVYKKGG